MDGHVKVSRYHGSPDTGLRSTNCQSRANETGFLKSLLKCCGKTSRRTSHRQIFIRNNRNLHESGFPENSEIPLILFQNSGNIPRPSYLKNSIFRELYVAV